MTKADDLLRQLKSGKPVTQEEVEAKAQRKLQEINAHPRRIPLPGQPGAQQQGPMQISPQVEVMTQNAEIEFWKVRCMILHQKLVDVTTQYNELVQDLEKTGTLPEQGKALQEEPIAAAGVAEVIPPVTN